MGTPEYLTLCEMKMELELELDSLNYRFSLTVWYGDFNKNWHTYNQWPIQLRPIKSHSTMAQLYETETDEA